MCFQSCPPRSSARTAARTLSWKARRPRWSARPSAPPSPKSRGEAPTPLPPLPRHPPPSVWTSVAFFCCVARSSVASACSASDRASDASHVCVGAALCTHKLAAKCFYIWAVIVNVVSVAASSPRCRWHVNSAQLQIKGLFLQEQLLSKLLLRRGRAGGWTDGWVGGDGCGFVCLGGVGGFSSSSYCVSPKTMMKRCTAQTKAKASKGPLVF